MSKKTLRDAVEQFGPLESWLIPVEDIARIIEEQACGHLLPSIAACRECFRDALFQRQIAILAERRGLGPDDARWVGEQALRGMRDGA